jgi:hypothetical protein
MRNIPEGDLLASLREQGPTNEDLINRLQAMAASVVLFPELVDAIDGAIGEIEAYEERLRKQAQEEDEWDRYRSLRASWNPARGIVPSYLTREAL